MKCIPEKVKEVVDEHIKEIESRLPKFLEAYYIYGSVSFGAFDYGNSDIDFIAVIKRKATETEIESLKTIHGALQRKFKKTIMDGLYLLKDDIVSLSNGEISCLRFNDGVFQGIKMFDTSSVDAFVLKKYGITVKGNEIVNFNYTVDFDILISKMKDNINTYWQNWAAACRRFPSIRYISLSISLKTIEWGVLGVSRLYFTFLERDITSKVGAGEYALRTVPQRWHKIIKEAMRLRKNIKKSYYSSVFQRRSDALAYIDFIIQESNKLFD
ncbi:MAG: hypothetical protein K0R46_2106 [Herbinix sp.]|jgi:hypothetical protein|nr:hypothetical protein [Herbinix sp.]